MTSDKRVSTVAEVIELLKRLPPDIPVYFDCPNCGKANELSRVSVCAVVATKAKL